ncbi:hypothetical protein SRHO_G00162780 [Serrasalmus rhombeus]
MEDAHTKTPEEVVAFFGVHETSGLTPDQVKKNLAKYGHNGESKSMSWVNGMRVDKRGKERVIASTGKWLWLASQVDRLAVLSCPNEEFSKLGSIVLQLFGALSKISWWHSGAGVD